MIISITALLLVTALFLIVREMSSRPGVEWWLGASLCQSIVYFLALNFLGAERTIGGDLAFYCLQMLVSLGATTGTQLFMGYTIIKSRRCMLFSIIYLTLVVFSLTDNPFASEIVFVLFNAFCMFLAAYSIFYCKSKEVILSAVNKYTAICFIFIGLHWLDYPFLNRVEWFKPIGFLLGMILGVSIFLLLSTLALIQFKKITKESERKAIQAAIHDPLTDIYNRSYLDQLFLQYTKQANKLDRPFVFLYMDLDGFKGVNDTYGHKAGDNLLKIITKRMQHRLGDRGDIVRVGGDELIVMSLLRGKGMEQDVHAFAEFILSIVEKPVIDGKNTYRVSASIGVCCFPIHSEHLAVIQETADGLMYEAKKAGGKCIRYASFPRELQSDVSKPVKPLVPATRSLHMPALS